MFGHIYQNKKVLITGHTGFKGSWLALWLSRMNAQVAGYALAPATTPSHFDLLDMPCQSFIGDIRNTEQLRKTIIKQQPEIIFHLAAQPLVRRGYREPVETFSTNVMGTINLLEACRACSSLKAVIIVTSDKCYENRESGQGYREDNSLGGHDPYSASKGCAEIVTSCYRRSFFSIEMYKNKHSVLIASARAGNVIGGGDWSEDRLIPDIVKAVGKNKNVIIRNPASTRPWQHVLESLSGYLMLGQKLLEGNADFADAWNFGPNQQENYPVQYIVAELCQYWPKIKFECATELTDLHEAGLLNLDCSKANSKLGWKPIWNIKETVQMTIQWYQQFYENKQVISQPQLQMYLEKAKQNNVEWACS